MENRPRTDGTLFTKQLIERPVQGGQPEASSVKIDSKEKIGRTSGGGCCNRQFQKDKGWERRLKMPNRTPGCNNRSLALKKTFG
ncbi:MAG: hypothetical protein WCI54_13680 [Bacteroidia bacterium]